MRVRAVFLRGAMPAPPLTNKDFLLRDPRIGLKQTAELFGMHRVIFY